MESGNRCAENCATNRETEALRQTIAQQHHLITILIATGHLAPGGLWIPGKAEPPASRTGGTGWPAVH